MKSFYTTPQNMLLSQLLNDFPDLALIKGRRHYKCAELLNNGNCDNEAPCKQIKKYKCPYKYKPDSLEHEKCSYCEYCSYWTAKKHAINSQTVLTNFAYFVLEGLIPENSIAPHFKKRELLIVDEGHDIAKHILNHVSLTISKWTLPYSVFQDVKKILLELPTRIPQNKIDDLLETTFFLCQNYLNALPSELTKEQVKNEKKANDFIRRLKMYLQNLDADWIGQIEKKSTWIRAKIQPIFVKNFMHKYLWRRAERFIISSATIFRHNFVKETGLLPYKDKICYTKEIRSTFPIKNRMIIDATVGKVVWNRKHPLGIPLLFPAVLDTIRKILNIEKGKGIIHAHKYDFVTEIKKGILNPRLIFHTSKDRDKKLKKFLKSPTESGKVLVAVAMTEGLDLRGDLATFQIMIKCPYANQKDLRVYRRLTELGHNRWYAIQTLKQIVQAYGRAVRSPTDKANFYIIDSKINEECHRWRSQLPRFFRETYDAKRKLL